MRGTKAVRIGRELLYAFVVTEGEAIRLRVSAEECDRLDLFVGKQVPMGVGDAEITGALVVGVTREPPFVWVAVEFAAPVRGM